MLSNIDIDSKHFSFRLFLDDHLIGSPLSEEREAKLSSNSTPFTSNRNSSQSSKLYYCELEELDTFCCLDDTDSMRGSSGREATGSFSLLNSLPKPDKYLFSDLLSILSRGSESRTIDGEELAQSVNGAHFENLRLKLLEMLEEDGSLFGVPSTD